MNQNTDIIKNLELEIDSFKPKVRVEAVGEIIQVGDGIALIQGLNKAVMGEILQFPHGIRGVVLNLNVDSIGAIVLGNDKDLKQGDTVRSTGLLLSIPASEDFIGRVVNPLGDPLDGRPAPKAKTNMPLERIAPSVIEREAVNTPLQTGVLAIDSMIPIGRGQRQLIIGDRSTGKSSIALTTIINQTQGDVICIYVAIGQKSSFVAQTMGVLEKHDALKHTIIVSASASEPASLQYLAPYAGCALGEYFAQAGKDVLIIYDDLSKHAWAYREVSLLLRRPSGREAYPGDIFYLHSRLLERAVKFSAANKGGSLTALPIIETQAGDLSAYIPTNVISITDGQIFLDTSMFLAGQRPAIDIGLSVSRVGGAAQLKAIKQVVGTLKIDMAQFRELAAFAQFSSDLDPKTKAKLERGQRITEILKQGWESPVPVEEQIALFWTVSQGYLDTIKIESVKEWQNLFMEYLRTKHKKTLALIEKEKKLTDDIEKQLKNAIETFQGLHEDLMVVSQEAQE